MKPGQPGLGAYIGAHRKVILGLLALVLVQIVSSDTADWIVTAAGTILFYYVPNDEYDKARIYGR